ncbi:MAG TPA: gliding motility-associated C-terminal domain-containing protein, partial [Chitinophagaceae bacterium]|nr:gliding motility-associated C-terminal domain-containing protein [Chitinophagaceae bacterium]
GPDNFSSSSQNPVINTLTAVNNGTYYVTLTTSSGCTNIDSVNIDVRAVPSVDAGSDVVICEGSTTTLQGSGSESYSWSPASGLSNTTISNPAANPTDSTTYILTVSNGQCTAYDSVHVYVWKKPTANAGPDKKIYEGDAVQLEGSATGTNVYYEWTPGYNLNDISILNPVVTPTEDTTYILQVISNYGCRTATDKVFVRVYKKITIPNAFSPNNDGINDTWSIDKLNTYPEADISVFNRYGQLVFKSKGYANQWDGKYNGKPLPVGTYYYVFDLKTGLGNPSGWVLVLR